MPLLRSSPSDYTAVVKSLAVAGAAVSNPQGSRPPSKGSVAFVNVSSTGALIRGSPRLVTTPAPKAAVVPALPALPVGPNYTIYETSLVFTEIFFNSQMTRDASGNFYGRPSSDYKYYKYSPTGTKTFLAGDGNTDPSVFTPGLGAAARFGGNSGVKKPVVDSSGNLFTVHTGTHRIIKIEPNGNVTSYAGTGTQGYSDGPIGTATFGSPIAIEIDASDTLYVSEASRKTIRKITSGGQVSTLTFSAAFSPSFYGLAVDSLGILYALDSSLHRVYKITPTGPTTADIALLAGSTSGFANGQGSAAQFNLQVDSGICVDRFGNVYVGDKNNGYIRKISPSGNVITIAGTGVNAADRPSETNTLLYFPAIPMIDSNGILYIGTGASIRKISPVVASLANTGSNWRGFVVKYNSSGLPLWARRIGGTAFEEINSVCTDSNQNVIITGLRYVGSLIIYAADGISTFATLPNVGAKDTITIKYNSAGTPLWARRIGGTDNDEAMSVTADSNGNVIVVGTHTVQPITIYASNGTTPVFTLAFSGGYYDTFVVKYDSDGTPLWARKIAGNLEDQLGSVSSDSAGNIVVAGYFYSTPLTIFDADGVTPLTTLTNAGGIRSCIVKYNSAGQLQWVKNHEGGLRSMNVDSAGNIVVTGYYVSTALTIFNADGTTTFTTLPISGNDDTCVVKYQSDGTPLWARRIGGTGTEQGLSVTTDPSGNVIVYGYSTSASLNIYASNGTTPVFTLANTASIKNLFIVKYNSSGTPQWARRLTTFDDSYIYINTVSSDPSGNVIVTGFFSVSSFTVFNVDGSTAFATLTNSGGNDGYIVKYDSAGTPQWAKRLGGTGNDRANSIATDSSGNIVVGGYYASNPLTIT